MIMYIYNFLVRIPNNTILADVLEQGAKKNGYEVEHISAIPPRINEKDIFVCWNRHLNQDEIAEAFEKAGASVWLFENPYINIEGEKWWSVAKGFHNDIKYAPEQRDNGERFKSFNKEIKPWKTGGDYYLVATQAKTFNGTGIGHEKNRQPFCWDQQICNQLNDLHMEILFRQHPNGRERGRTDSMPNYIKVSDGQHPIQKDLEKAYCTVVYTSNAVTESLLEGVPVSVMGPNVFLQECCSRNLTYMRRTEDRERLFNRLAWAQYSIDEVKSGFIHEIMS